MPAVALGTAHLFALVDPARSGAVLASAWEAGFRRYDTAPSYGHGLSEPALGTFLAGRDGVEMVSTKVGLAPAGRPTGARRAAAAVARRVLPGSVVGRLRGASGPPAGRFAAASVRRGVERSLARLGRIERLLLHEITPGEVDDPLRAELARLLATGDVAAVGVATRNHLTGEVVHALGDLVTVAHLAVGPFHQRVELPPHVTTRVGHGLLGEAGTHLSRLTALLGSDASARERWAAAADGTTADGAPSLADALLARPRRLDVTDVVVATSRPERVGRLYAVASGASAVPDDVLDAVDALVATAGATPA